jgi:hypothetical protein
VPKVVAEPAMTRREVVNGLERVVDRTVGLHSYKKTNLLMKTLLYGNISIYSIASTSHLDCNFSHDICQACRGRKVTA